MDLESLDFIPNEYLGADSLTSFSASSGLYAPGDGVTKFFGSFGLICIVGAFGSSLPIITQKSTTFNILRKVPLYSTEKQLNWLKENIILCSIICYITQYAASG